MYILSVISFLLLGGFLLLAAMRFGVPAMVIDVITANRYADLQERLEDAKRREQTV